ncbi:hypothetical protein F4779DRAFT_606195 [Xylariaceae sp. FL0662B]|nr:hypothetical protein F4779DRAFT_606195 [Xylariaceae sp. FL0662B]
MTSSRPTRCWVLPFIPHLPLGTYTGRTMGSGTVEVIVYVHASPLCSCPDCQAFLDSCLCTYVYPAGLRYRWAGHPLASPRMYVR